MFPAQILLGIRRSGLCRLPAESGRHDRKYLLWLARLPENISDSGLFRQGFCFAFQVVRRVENNRRRSKAWVFTELTDELIAVHRRHQHV